jgi:hypothetical protein
LQTNKIEMEAGLKHLAKVGVKETDFAPHV